MSGEARFRASVAGEGLDRTRKRRGGRFRTLFFAVLATVIALVIGACGAPGEDDGGSGEGEGDGPITIGSAMPLTGPYASDGEEMNQALEMAIAEYNDEGGVLDRQVELVTCDIGAMEVDTIQACGERLLGEDPDAIITGYDDSGVNTHTFGVGDMPYLHAVTMRQAVDPVIENPEEYGNVFQYDPSDRDYGTDAAERLPAIADQLGFEPTNESIAIITTDYAYNTEGAESFKQAMEEQGYETAVEEITPFGVEEWGPILTQIQQAEPAFVTFWNLDPSDAARFMNQWNRTFGGDGINSMLYMQYTPSIPEFLELAGDAAEGLLWSTVIAPNDDVGRELGPYRERFVERYGNAPRSIHGYVVRDAFDIWAESAEEAGCVRCFEDVISNIREIEFAGFAGNYDFTPLEEGQFAQQGDELIPTVWSQVQNGQNVQVLPDNVADGDIQLPPWIR